jgi:hypothetical protein
MDALRDFLFGKPLTPEEAVKKWRRELAGEGRQIDRNIRGATTAIFLNVFPPVRHPAQDLLCVAQNQRQPRLRSVWHPFTTQSRHHLKSQKIASFIYAKKHEANKFALASLFFLL